MYIHGAKKTECDTVSGLFISRAQTASGCYRAPDAQSVVVIDHKPAVFIHKTTSQCEEIRKHLGDH